jgi:hypothetical protein
MMVEEKEFPNDADSHAVLITRSRSVTVASSHTRRFRPMFRCSRLPWSKLVPARFAARQDAYKTSRNLSTDIDAKPFYVTTPIFYPNAGAPGCTSRSGCATLRERVQHPILVTFIVWLRQTSLRDTRA